MEFTVPTGTGAGGYLLVVSRLHGYKRVDLATDAAGLAGMQLPVGGSGSAEANLKAPALGTKTDLLGAISDRELRTIMGAPPRS